MNVEVPEGSLFYGEMRRRHDVQFDTALRTETEEAAVKLRELIASGITPTPVYSAKCKKCSLAEICLPRASKRANTYLEKVIEEE